MISKHLRKKITGKRQGNTRAATQIPAGFFYYIRLNRVEIVCLEDSDTVIRREYE